MILNRGFEGPRAVTPGEVPALLRMLDRLFRYHVKSGMLAEYPHIYGCMEEACGRHRIILRDGRIVGHVGVFPMEFVTPRGRVTAGGIGAVATEENIRGKGIMTGLLGEAVRWMGEQKMPLSILWGDRYRYQRFGWEPAGSRFSGSFSRRALVALSRFDMRSLLARNPGALCGEMHALQKRMPYRIEYGPKEFPLMLGKVGRKIWMAREGRRLQAWAVGRRDDWKKGGKKRFGWIIESWAGSLEGILSIIREMLDHPGADFARCSWPGGRTCIPLPVLEAADSPGFRLGYMGQIRVNDMPAVLADLGGRSMVPAIRSLGLNNREQARLLFGPFSPPNLLSPRLSGGQQLVGKLPLNLFLQPLDGI